jgi:hypothetical protein
MPCVSPFTRELALRTCEGLGGARALTVALMVKYGCWDDLSKLKVYPEHYLDSQAFARAAAATSLLKKNADLPTSVDRASVARENFLEGELGCYKSNERLSPFLPEHAGFQLSPDDERISEFFSGVRKRVTHWIGTRLPDFPSGRFGPGSTFSDRAGRATAAHKMDARPSITSGAKAFMPLWYETLWGRITVPRRKDPFLVRGNRFATVPKDATKDRGIAAEPSINVFYQLALGRVLRNRLRNSTGGMVDLNVAAEVHRRVACDASIDSRYATLDLRNASNSVSCNLVKLCLPHWWYEALESLRSPFTLFRTDPGLKGERWVKLEMFSSMGNGYTFELETILFAAIACESLSRCGLPAVFGRDVYVFGDDIIVPTDGARAVTAALEFCGFQLNLDKSFSEGNFRESCGGDFFNGTAVRPFFLKGEPHEPTDFIVIANGLRALDHQLSPPSRGDTGLTWLSRAWFHCLDQLPSQVRRCRGPNDLGDIVIHDAPEFWTTRTRWQVRYVRCYKPTRVERISWETFHPSTVLACAVYGVYSNKMAGITPRNPVMGFKIGWVPR